MIHAQVIGDVAVRNRLLRVPHRMQTEIQSVINRIIIELMAKVKGQKLSGEVLNVVTGRLRRSINSRLFGAGTAKIEGHVGTNVVYARPHEMGFSGSENVKAHLRTIKQAWGHPLAEPRTVMVSSHSRNVNIPEKSFLRSALREMEPQIRDQIAAAVKRAAHE
jgi:phage gpG-like protein